MKQGVFAAALAATTALLPAQAVALPSDVDTPVTQSQQVQVSQRSSMRSVGDQNDWKHETSVGIAPTDWLSLQAGLEWASPTGQGPRGQGVEVEAEVATGALTANDLRLGLEAAYTFGLDGEPDSIGLKGIAAGRLGDLRWTTNVGAERDHVSGAPWTSEYGVRLDGPLSDDSRWVGELLGDIDPGAGEDPAHVLGGGVRWTAGGVRVEPALFVGLTGSSPDWLVRFSVRL